MFRECVANGVRERSVKRAHDALADEGVLCSIGPI